ncbi:hypothetical protein O0L34_g11328 [Tuta absoluta]|nr:hypothetical protein O0L34_g11328 [Tuta absoluta]
MSDRQWLTTIAVAICLTACVAASSRCKLMIHVHRAEQKDLKGNVCWDNVKIRSCRGYCLTYETPHWQFPYKESHHVVCVHDGRKHKFVQLRNCDPGVEPNTEDYHYVEAASCKCKICSSDDTSCEWLPPDSTLIDELLAIDRVEPESMENSIEID